MEKAALMSESGMLSQEEPLNTDTNTVNFEVVGEEVGEGELEAPPPKANVATDGGACWWGGATTTTGRVDGWLGRGTLA